MAAATAVIAALPRELSVLARGAKPDPALKRIGISLYRTERAWLAAAGMGSTRVTLAFEAVLARAVIGQVISVGLAGACVRDVSPGAAMEVASVVDGQTGERRATELGGTTPILVSSAAVADAREKRRLAATYGAVMVDMEAATLGRLSAAHGLPFRAIKGISDGVDVDLSFLAPFTGRQGEFRTTSFVLKTALLPGRWGTVAALAKNSTRALAAMSELVSARLEAPGAS